MKIVIRSDEVILNISAAISFSPNTRGLVVEMPGDQYFIVYNLFQWDLMDDEKVYYKEFKGWPEE